MKDRYFLYALLFFFLSKATVLHAQRVFSPDEKIEFSYQIDENTGTLKYGVNFDEQHVILPSAIGISNWYNNLQIEKTIDTTVNTVWKPVYGERAAIKDHYNQRIIVLKRNSSTFERLWLIVRVYNEGAAFRYYFPEDPARGGGFISISEEQTTFTVPAGTKCWFAPYAQAAYKELPVKNWPGESERPLTLKLANHLYASLGEAAMITYARTKFYVRADEENLIRCSMYGKVEQMGPYATPWRFIMIAEKPGDLLQNNDLVLNLNELNKIDNPQWIKPGKVMRINQLNTVAAKKVIDFASKHHIDYVHFDAHWYGPEIFAGSDPRKTFSPDLNMKQVVQYAKNKGIGVWVYVNQRALARYLDEILPIYKDWGIAGIKFGFVLVGSQHWSTWLHEAVKKCADYNLMVNIHDEYRPTGFSRTYPNLLTQEGVRGNEEFPDANTNTMLPFTRFISGAADYTIVYYSRRHLKPHLLNAPENKVLENTSCHQLALSVIYYSPLQYLYWYDNPEDIQGEPEIEFFDQLPTVWDDTKVLDGAIGSHITVARKKDKKWFVASITSNEAREISFPLSFLDKGKKYKLSLYTDDDKTKTRTQVKITRMVVDSKKTFTLKLKARGGSAMIIEEI